MKNLIIFSIFTILIIFSIQQISFGEESIEKEDRAKLIEEAYKNYKREIPIDDDEGKIEEKKQEKQEIKQILSKLKKLLPSEEKLDEITFRTIWKYIDKHSTIDEEVGIETITALLRDITRVYDPIVNKYKVSTIQIEIIKFDDIYELEYYWDEISPVSLEKIFNNAYLIGTPNENIDCMFNHFEEGAFTICKTDEYVVQSTIYDKYQEHFNYNKLKTGPKKLQINQDEMTTRIVQEVLKNIEKKKEIIIDYELFKILKSNIEIKDNNISEEQRTSKKYMENETGINKDNNISEEQRNNKLLGIEKDKKYGIQNFSCIKDEFGLITISGQFNNNHIKKDKLVLEILFLDYEQNVIFKNTANLLEINEYETKRFLGNAKISKPFLTCTVKLET